MEVVIGIALFCIICIICWVVASVVVYDNMSCILRRRNLDLEDWFTASATIMFAPIIGGVYILFGIIVLAFCIVMSPGLVPAYTLYRVAKRKHK